MWHFLFSTLNVGPRRWTSSHKCTLIITGVHRVALCFSEPAVSPLCVCVWVCTCLCVCSLLHVFRYMCWGLCVCPAGCVTARSSSVNIVLCSSSSSSSGSAVAARSPVYFLSWRTTSYQISRGCLRGPLSNHAPPQDVPPSFLEGRGASACSRWSAAKWTTHTTDCDGDGRWDRLLLWCGSDGCAWCLQRCAHAHSWWENTVFSSLLPWHPPYDREIRLLQWRLHDSTLEWSIDSTGGTSRSFAASCSVLGLLEHLSSLVKQMNVFCDWAAIENEKGGDKRF